MSARQAAELGDTHVGREVTATGTLVGVITVAGSVRLVLNVATDHVVEVHR